MEHTYYTEKEVKFAKDNMKLSFPFFVEAYRKKFPKMGRSDKALSMMKFKAKSGEIKSGSERIAEREIRKMQTAIRRRKKAVTLEFSPTKASTGENIIHDLIDYVKSLEQKVKVLEEKLKNNC